ncbi:hypothetical protein B0T10DRAFT_470386 [Thelonectria olida]|uniref:Uncharacterized protein n=1 Tax=Thelonectria olida TaxID=1576542 RepID=A0A9P8WGN1_9HYPO|nr:hypothetical protein B0T10DRAFT_470386 [Thelonectria olida]
MADKRVPSTLTAYGRRDGPVTPDIPTRFSYDHASRGEPATIGALLAAPLSPDRPLAFSDDELLPRLHPRYREPGQNLGQNAGRVKRSKRAHKPQPGGAFLLQDAVGGDDDHNQSRRPQRLSMLQKGKEAADPMSTSVPRDFGLGITPGAKNKARIVSPDTSQEDLFLRRREGQSRKQHASQRGQTALDVDSTQIVNMALNLSESRRIATRRNFSRTNPPRLAPVQDPAPGNNIRTHLQQQRKSMRNVSPKPPQAVNPRLSGVRSSSPLRSPFIEAGNEPYRYHFSTSTLARAQKAREHLELMSQYRLLLDLLPPLKLGPDRPSATSPPGSPANGKLAKFGSSDPILSGGREYNPLQYIRNRKVRARERMVIDGERQGFSDVDSVKMWLEKASQRAATLNVLSGDEGSLLPPFATADEVQSQLSLENNTKAALRVRRPRVDWFFEPCDLIADAYWVELDGHKHLIEDRNWFKIFPSEGAVMSRPMSRQTDDGISPFQTRTLEDAETPEAKDLKLLRPDTDHSQSSAKERAKQKLHSLGGTIHRHTPSGHNHHDFLRSRRDSFSDSDSDNDVKSEGRPRRGRTTRAGTISSHTNDLLEKQMLEMIAQEEKQRLSQVLEAEVESLRFETVALTNNGSPLKQTMDRKGSLTDPSDSDHRSIREKTQMESLPGYHLPKYDVGRSKRGRQLLDDIDSPQPMSPELNPLQKTLSNPPTGLELSAPSSRASSPSRNPFTKVKRALRDKTRDEGTDSQAEDSDRRLSMQEQVSPFDTTGLERHPSTSRPTYEGHKHHRTASMRFRGDDQVGLRGMFKGPRIDTVIRGGVSRLGDMLWRKDNAYDSPPDAFSDESENDQGRGRGRLSLTLSRSNSKRNSGPRDNTKHFLDSMPQFQHVSETYTRPKPSDQRQAPQASDSNVQSPKSSRGNLVIQPLKPDLPEVATSTRPNVPQDARDVTEPSEADSHRESAIDGARVAPMVRFDEPDNFKTRKWTIADQALPRECRVSKREIARVRTLILTSGIMAMEVSRRAQEAKKPLANASLLSPGKSPKSNIAGVPWGDIARLTPKASLPSDQEIPYCDHYPLASQTLSIAIETEIERWQTSADRVTTQIRPKLEEGIWCVRSRIADELSGMTGEASDLADETGKDLALGQLLKVKRVTDLIEELSRNRRRRFRWLRRGMWSFVEWVLVGFMWYVWFVVTIFRIFLGLGQTTWRGVRWLLWL